MPKDIVCAECGQHPPSQAEIELSADGLWYCSEHINKNYTLHLLDYIKTRIAVTKTEDEDQSKFVLRELVQNADDAYASILVLRFEKDALYIANDGRAFTTVGPNGQPGDFERAASVLQRFKEDEKESAGHFGSGFQTVYAISNRPEVHSNGISRALNPVHMTWVDIDPHRFSPYMSEPQRKGVLFRLPWRDDGAAETNEFGSKLFANRNYWPRWDLKSIRTFYDDARAYLRTVILCCQRLRTIRVIWAASGTPESYQAERNFGLDQLITSPIEVQIVETVGPENRTYYDWDEGASERPTCPQSFSRKSMPSQRRSIFKYLALSSVVRETGGPAYLVRESNGNVKIKENVTGSSKEIKKNFIHLLFPLFLLNGERQFLFSIIPLPRRGFQGFVFSAHFFPTEDRKDVDVQGNFGVNMEWYRLCMLSIAGLYKSLFPVFLDSISRLNVTATERQALVFQALPTREIGDWMRPGRDDLEWAGAESEVLFDWLFGSPILQTSKGGFAAPSAAFSVDSEIERSAVETLGITVYPKEFTSLAKQIPWLRTRVERKRFNFTEFSRIWKLVCEMNNSQQLQYGKVVRLPPPGINATLALDSINKLVIYGISEGGKEFGRLKLVPDSRGFLQEFFVFPKLPNDFDDFEPLLSPEHRIHPRFVEQVDSVELKHPIRSTIIVADLPSLIAQEIEQQPDRFKRLGTTDHRLLSRAVVAIVLHKSFAPNQAAGEAFLPIRFEEDLNVGSPPKVDNQHTGEKYHRDWVFAHQTTEVPGMTDEIRVKTRFLELRDVSDKEIGEVENALNIVALADNPDQPVNFVRHFVSGLHESLFEDSVLSGFLNRRDKNFLVAQKKAMQDAVQTYFRSDKTERWLTPKDIGDIPCLYDENEEWHPAKEFAVGRGTLLTVLEYRGLHPELAKWPEETLKAIGVTSRLDSGKLASRISQLADNPRVNRGTLANIVGAFIAGFEKAVDIATDLSDVAWIPVQGKLAKASEVLFPSQENKEIMGEEYSGLLDLSIMDISVRDSITEMKQSELHRKLEDLGIPIAPTVSQMIELVARWGARGDPPPTKLLHWLSQSLGQLSATELEEWRKKSKGLRFYWNKGWYSGEKIRILDDASQSGRANWSTGVLILTQKEAASFSHYLDSIGAEKGLSPRDFLGELELIAQWVKRAPERLPEVQPKLSRAWSELEQLARRISPNMKQEFRSKNLFFVGKKWYAPINVVIDDQGHINSPVTFENVCIIPNEGSPKNALVALDAKFASTLERNAALEFLSKCASPDSLTDGQYLSYLWILSQGLKNRWWSHRTALRWPCMLGSNVNFRPPGESYLANISMKALLRTIPILITSTETGFDQGLEDLAATWGGKYLYRLIKYDKFPEASSRDIESVLGEIHLRLTKIYPAEHQSLEWLGSLRVFRSRSRVLRFTLENRAGIIQVPCLVPTNDGGTSLILTEEEGLTSSSAQAIASWAVGRGFSPSKINELANTIVTLFTDLEYQDVQATQTPGYYETLSQLSTLYPGCEICGSSTPKDQITGETSESIKSIISDRGGLLKGKLLKYEMGNSLYLCPRHAILMGRGLVKLDFLEELERDKKKVADAIENAASTAKATGSLYQIPIQVYEGNFLQAKKKGWQTLQLSLEPRHANDLFSKLLSYIG